jgi:uncharacterized radical SAM protein YgiQ
MSTEEMEALGWDTCDVILVTGDAYVDHPSFGAALVGRLLEAQGFRVGILAQPAWTSVADFQRLGRPQLFFGVTGGNMDPMVNRYTADLRTRAEDAYSPEGAPDLRPDRASLVYAQRCREAYGEVPIVLGGIEASLRRIAHFDYWSDKVRRSLLVDAKADLLVFGNGERQVVEIAHRLARREPVAALTDIRGTAFLRAAVPLGWREEGPGPALGPDLAPISGPGPAPHRETVPWPGGDHAPAVVVRLPAFEAVRQDRLLYAQASRRAHLETNPGNARPLVQRHGDREVWLNPPAWPLTTAEMDAVYGLPYSRLPHRAYGGARIPAFEMIQHSVTILRGCFGGCSFCSITEHEGRIIQSRSEASVLAEIAEIGARSPTFTGVVSDLGGPTANMYRMACRSPEIEARCRRLSCVHPGICANLDTDHAPLVQLYRRAREAPGVQRILVASGVRYDLALRSPEYIRELVTHHVGGYLKIAPEHTEPGPLGKMMKPGIEAYDAFKRLFDQYSQAAGKEQYLIPYFIAAHPGTTDGDMLELALWLKRNRFRLDQVQSFLPSPMALATAMYHTGKNPLARVDADSEEVYVPRGHRQRRLHKAFLRYHDPVNWPLLREALRRMGRADLIGNGNRHLVPAWQPDTGQAPVAGVASAPARRGGVRGPTRSPVRSPTPGRPDGRRR